MFHILEIAERGFSLKITNSSFCAEKKGNFLTAIPLDEISAVLLSQPSVMLSGVLLSELGKHKIPLICCDKHYLPSAILSGIYFAGKEKLFEQQVRLSALSRGKIWQNLVQSKISGQNNVLQKWRNSSKLLAFAQSAVYFDDKSFLESKAAAIYWRELSLFPKRDRNAADANILFNYGYAVLYAAFAREIVIAGLLPDCGIHHHNRDNAFNLSSDLMEPLRPCIDHVVIKFLSNHDFSGELKYSSKQEIMRMIYAIKIKHNSSWHTLFSFVRESVRGFVNCLRSKHISDLVLPAWHKENHVDCSSL